MPSKGYLSSLSNSVGVDQSKGSSHSNLGVEILKVLSPEKGEGHSKKSESIPVEKLLTLEISPLGPPEKGKLEFDLLERRFEELKILWSCGR